MNGNGTSPSLLPNIPHITANIIPLSNVIKFYTQDAYKQLLNIIENLSLNIETESDLKRKKHFLELIVDLRSNFIKIYTLCKWAQVSKDVSKFIDLLNWFRLQEFNFDQILFQLQQLNNYGGAKLPNSDIVTAIEVLYNKKPTLPSYNYLKLKPISVKKQIEVLKDLNLTLLTRFALMNDEDLPRRFSYIIKDGRAYITVENEFEVSITVGNELIIDSSTDYSKSPFYFIDFKFLFGINPDTNLITYKDDKVYTTLPEKSLTNLEKISNQTLLTNGLSGLYNLLHKYSISFKLYLISKQYKDLLINSRWRNQLGINYQMGKSLIILNYWSSFYLSKNWRSFIELGIDSNYHLNYRWYKNGNYDTITELDDIFSNRNDDNSPTCTLNVESILLTIVNKHAELLIAKIHNQLQKSFDEEFKLINYHQILVKLSMTKSTIFSINPLTGHFYFIDPTPIQNQITKKINNPPASTKQTIVNEDTLINNVIESLIQLKLEFLVKEINNKLFTTEWLNNSIIKLTDAEINKLPKLDLKNFKIQFYRKKNWPSSWFLINVMSGLTLKTFWYVARIKSISGEWKIQWVQQLNLNEDKENFINLEDLNFSFFNNLSTLCSNMIIDHMIVEELEFRQVRFMNIDNDNRLVKKFHQDNDPSSIYESLYVLYNNDDLLPITNSSTSLFLKINLLKGNKMVVKLFGDIRNISSINIPSNMTYLKFFNDQSSFTITDFIDLLNSSVYESKKNTLDLIFNTLNKLNKLIKILDQLSRLDQEEIKIVENSMADIKIQINSIQLCINLPEYSNTSIHLTSNDDNFVTQLLIKFLNLYLSDNINKSNTIIGICQYLQLIQPILNSINKSQQLIFDNKLMLSNGLPRLQFDVNFITIEYFQIVYNIYSNVSNTKKIQKDKISITLSLKYDTFKTSTSRPYLKVSFKESLNSKNAKFKPLFELIFKNLIELNQDEIQKLNHDFLISLSLVEQVMTKITASFINFLSQNHYISTPTS